MRRVSTAFFGMVLAGAAGSTPSFAAARPAPADAEASHSAQADAKASRSAPADAEASGSAPADAEASRSAYVVIVANNRPLPEQDEGLDPLRYADDDGARFYEMFSLFARRVEILTVLDEESQRLHPEVAKVSRPPTASRLKRTLNKVYEDIQEASDRGEQTELFFVFVGHGSAMDNGEGVMHLLDEGFTRSDLFQHVVAPSPADTNHVIIDACNAFLFVAGRGQSKSQRIDRAVDQYLARETVAQYPNTGFLLSTSKAAEVHEWDGFRAGVFSHEVRSALLGGGDVDGDGAVTYPEVRAFLHAANGRVEDPRARLEPWVASPAQRNRAPLFDRAWVPVSTSEVRISNQMVGRWYVEDERGVRLVDLHVASDGPVTLTLSSQRDHFLRGQEAAIPLPTTVARVLNADRQPPQKISMRKRGGLAEAFRRDLFGIPFGKSFFEGYALSRPKSLPDSVKVSESVPEAEGPDNTVRHWVGASLLGVGVASVAAGVVFGLMAADDAEAYRTATDGIDAVADLRSQAQDRQTVSNILLGAGVAAAVSGIVAIAW